MLLVAFHQGTKNTRNALPPRSNELGGNAFKGSQTQAYRTARESSSRGIQQPKRNSGLKWQFCEPAEASEAGKLLGEKPSDPYSGAFNTKAQHSPVRPSSGRLRFNFSGLLSIMNRTLAAVALSLAIVATTATRAQAIAPANSSGTAKPALGSVRAKMLLMVGAMKTDPGQERFGETLSSVSRQALGELPGVRVLEVGEDADAASNKRRPPVVLITGKLCEVGQTPDGVNVIVTAKVEYFVHRMPGRSIAAVVSGVAKAKVAQSQVQKRRLREKLELELVSAAVESAVKRTAPALMAAVD